MISPDPYYGPVRLRVSPPERSQEVGPYLRRARVLMADTAYSPVIRERQKDGTLITVSERFEGEKLILVDFPPTAANEELHWGTWLTPTDELGVNGFTGSDPLIPLVPRDINTPQPQDAAFHSLAFYDDAVSRRPNTDIRRYTGFNTALDLGDTREFMGTSDNGQGISWDNVPTRHNQHLALFGPNLPNMPRAGGRAFDLGHMVAWASDAEAAAIYKKLAGTEYNSGVNEFNITSNATHWNCVFYKGKMVNLPEAYFQMNFAPIQVEYLERIVFNVRIGGCFYRDGKICYMRSAPFYSPKTAPVNRLDVEEVIFAQADITERTLQVSDQETIGGSVTLPLGDPNWDKYTWSDWVFNNDGSEVVSMKLIQEGPNLDGGYFRLQINWEENLITGNFIREPNLLKLDWGIDNTLLKLYGVSDSAPLNPRFTFTLPTGFVYVAQGINFHDLRHDTYIFGDYFYDDAADKSYLKFTLLSRSIATVIYDETLPGNPGTDITGNLINPALITEADDDFTLVAVSCQIAPGSGWPTKVYNSNFQLLDAANMLGKNTPALNPILRG